MQLSINSNRIKIIPFQKKYLQEYYDKYTYEISKYQYSDPFKTLKEAENFLNEALKRMDNKEMLELIILKNDETFLGSIQVFGLKEEIIEVGLWIKSNEQKKGYGYEALNAVLKYLKTFKKYKKCIYEVDKDNDASIWLVRKFKACLKDINIVYKENGKELNLLKYEINMEGI